MRKFYFAIVMSLLAFMAACDKPVNPAPAPGEAGLTLTSNPILLFKAEGGTATISYTIESVVEGAKIEVVSSEDWVRVASADTEGEIAVEVDENVSQSERKATLTVSYSDDSFSVAVMQAAAADNTVVVEANMLSGVYYAEFLEEGLGNYWVILTRDGYTADGGLNTESTFYRLDVFGALAADDNNNIPDGTYTYDESMSGAPLTIRAGNSTMMSVDAYGQATEHYYDSAVLTVQGHKLTLEAVIDGAKHYVTFNQEYQLPVRRPTDAISSLKEDVVMDVEGYAMRCESFGDYWKCGGCNWVVELVPEEMVNMTEISDGVNLIIDFNTTHQDASGGFVGCYNAGGYVNGDKTDPLFAPGTFVSGVRISAEGHLSGSLYLVYAEERIIDRAPLVEGTVEITNAGNGIYTLRVEAWDDATTPHKITVNWSGEPYFR